LLNLIHFVTDLDRRSGGLSVSVPNLCKALADFPEVRVCLAARPTSEPVEVSERSNFRIRWIDGGPSSVAGVFSEMADLDPGGRPLVHLQGLWDPVYHWASRHAARHGLPVVVSIRGMLEPWALKHKGLKKKLAWHVYQRRNLLNASALHVTSPAELDSIKRVGLPAPSTVFIPNGVTPPPDLDALIRSTPRERTLLFLGRLHRIKGLINLIDAWADHTPSGWTLQLTGPDCEGHRSELEARIRRRGIGQSVRITEMVAEEEKWRTLASASALVLPSFSENFGLVVAEALAAGTPVAATTGSPWSCLETEGAGWWVHPQAGTLTEFLRKLESTPAVDLVAMGERGRALVARNYTWPGVASRFAEVYRELANETAARFAANLPPPTATGKLLQPKSLG
jgi:glycosyltransferase involved in cell wall biosynthesis